MQMIKIIENLKISMPIFLEDCKVSFIKEMGIDFKTTDGSEIRLEEKEESVFPEFTENAEPPQPIIAQ